MGCTLFVFYILHIAGYYFRKEDNRRREKLQRTLGWEIDKTRLMRMTVSERLSVVNDG